MRIVLFILLFSLGVSINSEPITSPLVAIPDNTDGGLVNPAGLGVNRGLSIRMDIFNSDSSFQDQGRIWLRMGNLSGHTSWGNGPSTHHFAWGTRILKSNLLMMGTAMRWREGSKYLDFGILSRPYNFISVGAGWKGAWSSTDSDTSHLVVGCGIRPFNNYNRISLLGGMEYILNDNDHDPQFSWGLNWELIKGFQLTCLTDQEQNFNVGVQISFGHNSIGTEQLIRDEDIDYGYSYLQYNRQNQYSVIPRNKNLLSVDLSQPYYDHPPRWLIFSQGERFFDLVYSLEKNLHGHIPPYLYLNLNQYCLTWSQTEEVRELLLQYQQRGTRIIVYADDLTDHSYYLACLADRIFVQPQSYISVDGLAWHVMFISGALEKLDIEVDLAYQGEYKSAVEMFTREDMSAQNREAREAILDKRTEQYYQAISSGRNIDLVQLESIIDQGPFTSQQALQLNLVDSLLWKDELEEYLTQQIGCPAVDMIADATETYREDNWIPRTKIALINAEGTILTGESGYNPIPIPTIGGHFLGSETMIDMIRAAKDDPDIKVVVIRVNSPGGSSLASEMISREIQLCREIKPVIISMGDVAASGGYHISTQGNRIFCDHSTVTGSIGVFAIKPVFSGMYENWGITYDTITSNANALMWSSLDTMTDQQHQKMMEGVEQNYNRFVSTVADARGMDFQEVNQIAQGRVWSGDSAVKLGLTDQIGGLNQALSYSAELINLKHWSQAEIVINPGISYSVTIPGSDILSGGKYNIIDPQDIFWNNEHLLFYDPSLLGKIE